MLVDRKRIKFQQMAVHGNYDTVANTAYGDQEGANACFVVSVTLKLCKTRKLTRSWTFSKLDILGKSLLIEKRRYRI